MFSSFARKQLLPSVPDFTTKPCSRITNGFIGTCGFESLVASNTLLSHNLHTGPRQLNLVGISESHPFYSTVSTVSNVSSVSSHQFYSTVSTASGHSPLIILPGAGVMIRRENLENISRSVFVDSLLLFVFF